MTVDAQASSIEALASDIRAALKADPSLEGKQKVASLVSRALLDKAFVKEHLKDRAPGELPREVLYEDDDMGEPRTITDFVALDGVRSTV